MFAFQEITVQNVIDNLQCLPGEHNRKQKREQVDAPVEQVRARHRRENRSCDWECRNKNQLRLLKEVDNQEQQDENRRDDAHHLGFGQQALACLDGLVNFAGVVDS